MTSCVPLSPVPTNVSVLTICSLWKYHMVTSCCELPSRSCPSLPDLGVKMAPPSVLLWTLATGTTNIASALATVAVEEFDCALLLRSGYAVLQVTPY